jgi:general secretion pathway protein G
VESGKVGRSASRGVAMSVSRNALTFNTLHFRTHPTLTERLVWHEDRLFAVFSAYPLSLSPSGMLSDNPRSVSSPHTRSAQSGFTLIELLTVIAVIAALAAITFGISGGVQNAKSRTRAKAELAVLSQAMEQFKSRNGDYPWSSGSISGEEDNAKVLFQALVGWLEFTGSGATAALEAKTSVPASGPVAYIDISKLTYVNLNAPDDFNPEINLSSAPSNYVFLDPWGNPYVYFYGKQGGPSNTWEIFGFHLYSIGADELDDSSVVTNSTGIKDPQFREAGAGYNIDNIYSGE